MGKSIESRENWIGADRHDRRGVIYVSSAAARRRRVAGAVAPGRGLEAEVLATEARTDAVGREVWTQLADGAGMEIC